MAIGRQMLNKDTIINKVTCPLPSKLNIKDNKERMRVLTNEIIRLNSLSSKEWSLMLKEMLPTIKKNLRNLMNSYDKKDVLSFNYSEPKALPPELIDISS